jgi:co-chaperonin GroES (HSP10)
MLRPMNGRVFVERDPDVQEVGGIAVGDKAKTKALMGAVVASDSDFAPVGCRIHLPHQRAKIEECLVDGRDVACVKEADLFGIDTNGAIRPVNRYIKVRKCENDHVRDESGNIALYMTDNHIEATNWIEILEVADDCEWVPQDSAGWFAVCPENDDKLQRCGRTMDYFVHESLLKFITDGQ